MPGLDKSGNRTHGRLAAIIVCIVFAITGFVRSQAISTSAQTQITTSSTTSRADSPSSASATQAVSPDLANESQEGVFPKVLLILFLILGLAKIGGDIFERLGQPAVLGELFFGILLGNLGLLRLHGLNDFVQHVMRDPHASTFISTLAEVGVVLLLFEVGLSSTVREMMSVGLSSFLVACAGVIAPMGLGYLVGIVFLPHEPWTVHLFLATVLAATSVGITARVFGDLGKMHLREAKIIVGAAVIDDILGLVVLAATKGIFDSWISGQPVHASAIVWIFVKAMLFFVISVAVGVLVSRRIYRLATFLQVKGVLLSLTLMWCFFIAWLGTLFGLAPIVGAFAAGLVLEDATYRDWQGREGQLEDLVRPLTTFLVPVFFVSMGMKVNLAVFGQVHIFAFAAALTIAAIIGKQVCALAVVERGLNRLAVGIGMIPRGEVGLIVASIGFTLKTPEGHRVISMDTFSATVIMVILTTMLTPPVLKWALAKKPEPVAPQTRG